MQGRITRGELAATTIPGTYSTLLNLAEVHGRRPLRLLGARTMERWLESRRALMGSTKRTQWSCISCFFDWMVEDGALTTNPCRRMTKSRPKQPRREPRALDADAVGAVLATVPDARARAIVWLEVGLGLRSIEVHRARVEDWSRRDGVIRVTGKGGHQRDVPVVADAAMALDAYLSEHPATSGPLIRSYTRPHRPLSVSTLSHYMSDWMYLAGVKHAPRDGVSQHALRHTAASDVLAQCDDLRVVQELLGHMHLSSTAIYLRRAGLGKMREAMEGRIYA